jgi:hypothetical protein
MLLPSLPDLSPFPGPASLSPGEEPQYIPRDFRITPLVAYLNKKQKQWLSTQVRGGWGGIVGGRCVPRANRGQHSAGDTNNNANTMGIMTCVELSRLGSARGSNSYHGL